MEKCGEQKENLAWGCFLLPHCFLKDTPKGGVSLPTHEAKHTHIIGLPVFTEKNHSLYRYICLGADSLCCGSLTFQETEQCLHLSKDMQNREETPAGNSNKDKLYQRGLSGKCQVCHCRSRTKGCVFIQIWQLLGQLLLSLSKHSLKHTSPHDLLF